MNHPSNDSTLVVHVTPLPPVPDLGSPRTRFDCGCEYHPSPSGPAW